jgi:hypothetical protein
MGPIISPETSVLNHLTPRNNPEDRPIKWISYLPVFININTHIWLDDAAFMYETNIWVLYVCVCVRACVCVYIYI